MSTVRQRRGKRRSRALKQRGLTGLCGPYAVVNALGCILPLRLDEGGRRALAREIAAVLPVGLRAIMREGTDREQLAEMLGAAHALTSRVGLEGWTWSEMHPEAGETAAAFWRARAEALVPGRTAAVVGFGDYHRPSDYYEPHWTCAETVAGSWISCLDSDEYDRIRLSETGIRPEPGWEIEDCFLLGAPAAA